MTAARAVVVGSGPNGLAAAITLAREGVDGRTWRRLFEPLARHFPELAPDVFGPLLGVPSHPLLMASFGAKALVPATALARR